MPPTKRPEEANWKQRRSRVCIAARRGPRSLTGSAGSSRTGRFLLCARFFTCIEIWKAKDRKRNAGILRPSFMWDVWNCPFLSRCCERLCAAAAADIHLSNAAACRGCRGTRSLLFCQILTDTLNLTDYIRVIAAWRIRGVEGRVCLPAFTTITHERSRIVGAQMSSRLIWNCSAACLNTRAALIC